ncbi:MAG: site-specific integrase [Opitutaceae bacterium]|jgi:hypothetical protein|nr:site-specific integrase [Opitutaceae bacterium]
MSSVFSTKRITVAANGYTYTQWKVEGRIAGVRVRKFFPNREEAEGYRQLKEVEALNGGHELRASVTHLTADQLRQAEAAFRRLGEKPLLAAVDWYLDTYRDTLTKKTVKEAYPGFLDSIRDEVRQSTIDDYTSSLKAFGEFTDKRSLPEIRGDDVEAFLTKRGLKKKSWNNTRADLHAFFAWAEKAPRKWITSNPVAEVKTITLTRGLPEIISVRTARDLMSFVATYRGQGKEPKPAGFLVPYFSLALFAGIRPAINEGEIIRLGRLKNLAAVIDLKNRVIRITPEIAKTKDIRQVTIQPNLESWLRAYPGDKFPITPPSLFDEVSFVRKKFALGHDVLRHTFITMHVTKFRSMGDTALQSGNSEKMIKKHYLNIANPDDADAFWSIVPAN